MSRLYYSQHAEHQLKALAETLPSALLIDGVSGMGSTSAARNLAGKNLATVISPINGDGETDYSPRGIIRIAQIREMTERARGKSSAPRIFIIDEAERMNIPAQNAFLKLLEEPANNVHFILTTHYTTPLLPTVISRVMIIHLDTISDDASASLLDDLRIYDQTKRRQLLYLAAGRPAELVRLATNDAGFQEHSALVASARRLLEGTPYDRVLALQPYLAEREEALKLLAMILTILQRSIQSNPTPELVSRANSTSIVYDRIVANGNVRLQLLTLVV